jgi:hypothetical protein
VRGERNDIAANHPEIVQRLKKAYDDWFADVNAGWQIKN